MTADELVKAIKETVLDLEADAEKWASKLNAGDSVGGLFKMSDGRVLVIDLSLGWRTVVAHDPKDAGMAKAMGAYLIAPPMEPTNG